MNEDETDHGNTADASADEAADSSVAFVSSGFAVQAAQVSIAAARISDAIFFFM